MMSPSFLQRRRAAAPDGQRGAAAVEFAIVSTLLLTILFGIIDFGTSYNDYISLRQGTRDGVRQAVTGRVGTDVSCTIAGTAPTNVSVRRLVCLAKSRVGLPASNTRVAIDVNDPAGADRGSIDVCVMYPLKTITGLTPLLNGKVVRTEVQMRTEQTVTEAMGAGYVDLVDYQEPAISGQNWTFCVAEDT
jgi:TadE-like protein